ncbi:hypothetical protein FUA48_08545 [Flavobacterium alkalisoli]|uniref:Uncharacterized protein n=1 Tax=Flavobacterium alkalisoli TaxID=2602769 RepID=A0A5B9FTS6_9FLAO|nr:hypothetical protein [Flavobacterium alkalisoli]QEE49629.1 hypothetical protein FUA48_08545 [Flavobacterium alkalisoli]
MKLSKIPSSDLKALSDHIKDMIEYVREKDSSDKELNTLFALHLKITDVLDSRVYKILKELKW